MQMYLNITRILMVMYLWARENHTNTVFYSRSALGLPVPAGRVIRVPFRNVGRRNAHAMLWGTQSGIRDEFRIALGDNNQQL